jgi:hypothetical protein
MNSHDASVQEHAGCKLRGGLLDAVSGVKEHALVNLHRRHYPVRLDTKSSIPFMWDVILDAAWGQSHQHPQFKMPRRWRH